MQTRIYTAFLSCVIGVVAAANPLKAQVAGGQTVVDRAQIPHTRKGTNVDERWAPPSHSLLFQRRGAAGEVLPPSKLEPLSVALGRTRVGRSAMIGGLVGFLVGGTVGAALAYEDCTANGSESCMGLEPWQIAGLTGVVFGIPTGLLGAVIGARIR